MEHMVEVVFDGGDAARVLAVNDIGDCLWDLQFHFLHRFAVFDDIDGGVRIDEAEEVVVDVNDLVDFDDVFFAHLQTEGVHNEGHVVVGVFEVQVVENGHAISGFDVVNDDTSFYTVDF